MKICNFIITAAFLASTLFSMEPVNMKQTIEPHSYSKFIIDIDPKKNEYQCYISILHLIDKSDEIESIEYRNYLKNSIFQIFNNEISKLKSDLQSFDNEILKYKGDYDHYKIENAYFFVTNNYKRLFSIDD
jgi:hypothetical protein